MVEGEGGMIHFECQKQKFSVFKKTFEKGGKGFSSNFKEFILSPHVDTIPLDIMYCMCKYWNNPNKTGNITCPPVKIPTREWKRSVIEFLDLGQILCKQLKMSELEREFQDYKVLFLTETLPTTIFSIFSTEHNQIYYQYQIEQSNIRVCSYCHQEFRKYQTIDTICSNCMQTTSSTTMKHRY